VGRGPSVARHVPPVARGHPGLDGAGTSHTGMKRDTPACETQRQQPGQHAQAQAGTQASLAPQPSARAAPPAGPPAAPAGLAAGEEGRAQAQVETQAFLRPPDHLPQFRL
jgi:hypothetical protein